MPFKLDVQHKHVLKLIKRDRDNDGWVIVSDRLYPHLSINIPPELVVFEKLETGGRAKLTEEGESVLNALEWLSA